METCKKGISLIVLVITIIILAILATAVILILSNTNIIEETTNTTFKSDMANYKDAYNIYLASKVSEDKTFNQSSLNVTSTDEEFTEIFGENVPEKYKTGLQIKNGKLVYNTSNETEKEIIEDLGMNIVIIPLDQIAIGDLVAYTPTADADGTYTGATYVWDADESSDTYHTYIERTTDYTPGEMKWVYLGQDEDGNVLLTSQEATSFTMTIAGQDGFVTGPDRLDTLCNTLYGNSTYGYARNMKVEDVNRTLGYPGETGNLGSYYNASGTLVPTSTPKTIGDIETELGTTLTNRQTPRLSETLFEDYLANQYIYTGTEYKDDKTAEYRVIFRKADGITNQSGYFLSSACVNVRVDGSTAYFSLRRVYSGNVTASYVDKSSLIPEARSNALRPVIVLGSNIQFGEKNSSGEWTLVVQ